MFNFVHLFYIVIGFVFFSACSSSSDNSSASSKNVVRNITSKKISIEPGNETIVPYQINGNDSMEFRFSKDTFEDSSTKAIDFNVVVEYESGSLQTLVFTKDIVFSKPLKVAFKIKSLKNTNRYLRYKDSSDFNKNYFLPFQIEGEYIVYEFAHFSEYEAQEMPADSSFAFDAAMAIINGLMQREDKSAGRDSILNEYNEVVGLISQVALKDPQSAQVLTTELKNLEVAYSKAYVDESKYLGNLLEDYCLSSKFKAYVDSIQRNGLVVSEAGKIDASSTRILSYLEEAASEYMAININTVCANKGAIERYASCGADLMLSFGSFTAENTTVTDVKAHIEKSLMEVAKKASESECGKKCAEEVFEIAPKAVSAENMSILEEYVAASKNTCSIALDASAGDKEVDLIWAAVEHEVSSYNLYYAKESFSALSKLSEYRSLNGANKMSINSTEFLLSGLENNTTYYFKVSSLNSTGDKIGISQEVSARPNGDEKDEEDDEDDEDEDEDETKKGIINFTKIGKDGTVLEIQDADWLDDGSEENGTRWSCVRDDDSKLLWEVKNSDGSAPPQYDGKQDYGFYYDITRKELGNKINTGKSRLLVSSDNIHHNKNLYRWGGVGAELGYLSWDRLDTIVLDSLDTTYDDWDVLVNGSNDEKLCGSSRWEVPSLRQLKELHKKRYGEVVAKYLNAKAVYSKKQYEGCGAYTMYSRDLEDFFIGYMILHTAAEPIGMAFAGGKGKSSSVIPFLSQSPDVSYTFVNARLASYLVYSSSLEKDACQGYNRGIYSLSLRQLGLHLVADDLSKSRIDAGEDVIKTYGDKKFTQMAEVKEGSGEVTYSSDNTHVATVDLMSGEVTIRNAGTVTIEATISDDGEYRGDSDSYTLTVNKALPTLDAGDDTLVTLGGTITSLVQTPDISIDNDNISIDNPVFTFTSTSPSVASVNGHGMVNIISKGRTIIQVTFLENDNFLSVDDEYFVVVNSALLNQTIDAGQDKSYFYPSNINYFTQVATGYFGTGNIIYESSNENVATVSSDGVVNVHSVGNAIITVTIMADLKYNGAQDSYVLRVYSSNTSTPSNPPGGVLTD